jgi:hypothetical protein
VVIPVRWVVAARTGFGIEIMRLAATLVDEVARQVEIALVIGESI